MSQASIPEKKFHINIFRLSFSVKKILGLISKGSPKSSYNGAGVVCVAFSPRIHHNQLIYNTENFHPLAVRSLFCF